MSLILIVVLAAVLMPGTRPAQSLVETWTYYGTESGDEVGDVVRSAGRLAFSDSYPDIVVGAPGDAISGTADSEGVVYVFAGGPQGLGADPHWKVGGGQQGSRFGSAVDGAGDLDNNGYDDLVVGAWHYREDPNSAGTAQEGAVYVYCGPLLDSLHTDYDWRFLGNRKESYVGLSVAKAGDVNDDGYDDIIVGARWFEDVNFVGGAALVFTGTASCDLGMAPAWVVEGEQEGARMGAAVATAGDVNGDGIDDVVIGAPGYNGEAGADEGAVYVYYGSTTGLRDDRKPDWVTYGGQAGADFGTSVACAGDVDGDGLDDIVVGAPGYDAGDPKVDSNEGAAFVFLGTSLSTGQGAGADWMHTGSQAGSGFGISVGGAGDVDGDGYDDVVVGADHYNINDEGAAFVFYGSAKGLGRIPGWTARGEKASALFGHSVGTAGDLKGNGFDGIVAGAPEFRMYDREKVGMAAAFYGPLDAGYYRTYLPVMLK